MIPSFKFCNLLRNLTLVTADSMLLIGCSPVASFITNLSPKSQNICLKHKNKYSDFAEGH